MADYNVHIEGLAQLLKNLTAEHVVPATKTRMTNAVLFVERDAMIRAPGNTGELRSSLTHDVREIGSDIQGLVGSNKPQARWMEFGTGLLSEDPKSRRARHWPPAAALEQWAQRHGFGVGGGRIVARIIGIRGGLRPRRFLRNAFEANRQRIVDELSRIPRDVAEMLAKKG